MKRPKKLPRIEARVAGAPPRDALRSRFFAYPDTNPGPKARGVSRLHVGLALHGRAAVAWVTGCERRHHPGFVGESAIMVEYAFEDQGGVLRTGRSGGATYAEGERGRVLRRCLEGKKKAFTVLYDDEHSIPAWWLFSE